MDGCDSIGRSIICGGRHMNIMTQLVRCGHRTASVSCCLFAAAEYVAVFLCLNRDKFRRTEYRRKYFQREAV